MRFGICDDSVGFLNMVYKLCIHFSKNHKLEYSIKKFTSGEELLKYGSRNFDILLLDMRMPGITGLDVGREIRKTNPDVEIIYISSYAEFGMAGYEVQAYHYLLKDQLDRTFDTCLAGVVSKVQAAHSQNRYHYFQFVHEPMTLDLDDIMYIASHGRNATFYLNSRSTEKMHKDPYMNEKLDNLQKELIEYGFLRLQQSYLVNVRYIKSVKSYEAVLQNGKIIGITRGLYQDVKAKYAMLKGGF